MHDSSVWHLELNRGAKFLHLMWKSHVEPHRPETVTLAHDNYCLRLSVLLFFVVNFTVEYHIVHVQVSLKGPWYRAARRLPDITEQTNRCLCGQSHQLFKIGLHHLRATRHPRATVRLCGRSARIKAKPPRKWHIPVLLFAWTLPPFACYP